MLLSTQVTSNLYSMLSLLLLLLAAANHFPESLLGRGLVQSFKPWKHCERMESHLNLLTSDRLIQGVPDTIEERHCMGKGTPHWLEQFSTMLRRKFQGESIIKLPMLHLNALQCSSSNSRQSASNTTS